MTLTSFVSVPEFVSSLANPLLGNLRRAVNEGNTNSDSSDLSFYKKVCLTQMWYIYKKKKYYCKEKIKTQLTNHENSVSKTKRKKNVIFILSEYLSLHVWWPVFYLLLQVPKKSQKAKFISSSAHASFTEYSPELASKLPTQCDHSSCFTTQRYDYRSTHLKETALPLLLYGLSDGTSAHHVFWLKLLEERRYY